MYLVRFCKTDFGEVEKIAQSYVGPRELPQWGSCKLHVASMQRYRKDSKLSAQNLWFVLRILGGNLHSKPRLRQGNYAIFLSLLRTEIAPQLDVGMAIFCARPSALGSALASDASPCRGLAMDCLSSSTWSADSAVSKNTALVPQSWRSWR